VLLELNVHPGGDHPACPARINQLSSLSHRDLPFYFAPPAGQTYETDSEKDHGGGLGHGRGGGRLFVLHDIPF